ncbi:poly(U)-specific 3'-to-5' RNA exonuclease [Exophiala xenobiotica]|uniref:U6 snRNA phosphodiesterase n=1 Tax=Vermiconidia calcicola TaxID=1690605 RepID=A0AAV9QMR5_9PEZI|nr:poly(U)-specific 3'-to-5' RNA exonuclease [Exophiala xenobiotica]KAK5545792.1 poly(U)-specific 3'-to-5' RNA exonuclease [Vermiconidia calcicola]KAK5208713.1 poly(U)-specific 3'-to-5' RNA exonuclease [Exophiala xenobiotica]KAK5308256.1 poly(U)-specific 3'-to-5' RNA exonuclease [Exophiala xenobiotica]KAK5342850.1 poly(U)-specific 3'-to-5' RNA exonuclease [Exophiala xenobiotica]
MLVDYSDSSSESDGHSNSRTQNRRKRKAEDDGLLKLDSGRPPPLPASFRSLYATNVRTFASDDPALHAGRTRQVPHAIGNWPTHAYLEWYPSLPELVQLDKVIKHAEWSNTCDSIHSFLRSDLGAPQPLHISLSAPLVLKTDQKDAFQQTVFSEVSRSNVQPFNVQATGLDWVANYERSRFFLVLKLSRPSNNDLNRLLSASNAAARQFGLAELSDAFHISIAWTLKEPDKQTREQLLNLDKDYLKSLMMSFSGLKLKMGNVVIDIPFTKCREIST